MKNVLLLVMRHAKSDWSIDGQKDFDRVLNARGLKDAPNMGAFLSEKGFSPDAIISSSAERAKKTTALVGRGLDNSEDIISYDQNLYYGNTGNYLTAAQSFDYEKVSIGLLVGHNPLVEQFVQLLANSSIIMPTAGIACIQYTLENSWAELMPHSAQLKWFISPKLLG
jgi:phosphohistidine phosphatase